MSRSIDFNSQPPGAAEEIGEVATDGALSQELEAIQPFGAKLFP